MTNRQRTWKRHLTLATLFLVAALGAAALVPTSADALFSLGVCVYYSDATYSTVVGARGNGCCGEVINWGVTTPYRRCEALNCLDVLCPFLE